MSNAIEIETIVKNAGDDDGWTTLFQVEVEDNVELENYFQILYNVVPDDRELLVLVDSVKVYGGANDEKNTKALFQFLSDYWTLSTRDRMVVRAYADAVGAFYFTDGVEPILSNLVFDFGDKKQNPDVYTDFESFGRWYANWKYGKSDRFSLPLELDDYFSWDAYGKTALEDKFFYSEKFRMVFEG